MSSENEHGNLIIIDRAFCLNVDILVFCLSSSGSNYLLYSSVESFKNFQQMTGVIPIEISQNSV